MSRPAINIENIGKSYQIGQLGRRIVSFREAATNAASSFLQRKKKGDVPNGKSSETFWALRNVSFEVRPGEVVGIIGRNGAGKSTLLKILSRITEPTEGLARIRGRLASLLEVGTGFHHDLTGRENIYLNGSILGMKKAEIDRKFGAIVAFAEIDRFLDTQVKHYSTGMFVRLAFAVAAHLETQILIVDEVLAVGDQTFQKKCLGRIEEVTKQGRTVLFVSHNVPAVQNLCTRCVLLERGKLKMDADPETVLKAYTLASSGRSSSEMSLENHPGRSSSGPPCLRFVSVRGCGPNEHYICMGEDVEIEITFGMDSPLSDLAFWIFFKNNMNTNLFCADSEVQARHRFGGKISGGKAICRVSKLMFMPGTYSLDVQLGSPHNMGVDIVRDACTFEVHPSDVFGTGKLPVSVGGDVAWPATWEITSKS